MNGPLLGARERQEADAVAAREAEINGRPQRIEPLAEDDLTGELVELMRRVGASIGESGHRENTEYFRTLLKHPELLRRQLEMGMTLFTGRLPARDRELAVLRIAWLLQAPYEWGEHVHIAKRCGVTAEEVERATLGSAAPGWSEADAALLRAVEELLARQAICDETWAALAARFDEAQLIEFPMIVGQYVSTALVQNALRMRLTAENPGLRHR